MTVVPATAPEARALGAKTFFNDTPCKQSHLSERYASDGSCVGCAKARALMRYENKRPEILERLRAGYRNDPEPAKERSRDYQKHNPEKMRTKKRVYYVKHRERLIAYSKRWQEANAARAEEHRQEWIRNNPDKVHASLMKTRSARSLRKPRWLSREQRNEMRALYAEARRMTKETGVKYSVDHVVPCWASSCPGSTFRGISRS